MQLTPLLDVNEVKTSSNLVHREQSGTSLSEVTVSSALSSVSLVNHDVDATKQALSHLPNTVPQETKKSTDSIFIVDLGTDSPFDLLLTHQGDGDVHSKMNNVTGEPSLHPEQPDSLSTGALQLATHSRPPSPLAITRPLQSLLPNESPLSRSHATSIYSGQRRFTAVTPASTQPLMFSPPGSHPLTVPHDQLDLREQSQDVVSFAIESIEHHAKRPNPPPTKYAVEDTSSDTFQSLNKLESPHDTQHLPSIFCPELPMVIPLDSTPDVQHDAFPIFCPELPLVLFPDPSSDPPSSSRRDAPSDGDRDPQPIFLPDLPPLFPDPQTADPDLQPIFCPDLGDLTFQSLIGRPQMPKLPWNHRTAKDSPSHESPLGLIPTNQGVTELFSPRNPVRNDGTRSPTPIFTVNINDSNPLNSMELCSIGDEKLLQMSPAFNDKPIAVQRESQHSVF